MLPAICQTQSWNIRPLFSLNSVRHTLGSLLFFYLFFKSVHQPSFDPLECIKRSQIKRTWRRIHKQPHATFSLETPPFSATLPSFWSIYCQTSVPFSSSRLIHFIFTLLLPTWDACMTLDVLKFNNVFVCVSFLIKYYAIYVIHFCLFWGKPEVGAGEGTGAFLATRWVILPGRGKDRRQNCETLSCFINLHVLYIQKRRGGREFDQAAVL